MNKFLISITLSSLLFGGFGLTKWLTGSDNTAFVQNPVIFQEFKGKKELEAKIVKLQEQQRYILDSLGAELKVMNDQLKAGNEDPVFIEKYKSVSDIYVTLSENYAIEVEEKRSEYLGMIWSQINGYVREYGKKEGYDYIFGAEGSGSIMYAVEGKEITSDVVEYINKRYDGLEE